MYRRVSRFGSTLKTMLRLEQESGVAHDFSLLTRGFLSKRRDFYRADKWDLEWFISDFEVEHAFAKINPRVSQELLSNKLMLKLYLEKRGFGPSSPSPLGLLDDGKFLGLNGSSSIEEVLERHQQIFAKPMAGSGGRGCFYFRSSRESPRGLFLLEPAVVQHQYAERIAGWALNTIRILTMRGGEGFFIAGAAHRFGGDRNIAVDNFSQGGVACLVDLETGTLSEGVTNPGYYRHLYHEVHPVTSSPLKGVTVPFWDLAKQLALDLSGAVPGLNYAGWDIAITPAGPVVIEGNGRVANPNLIQAHCPLLLDERVARFLTEHGVLSKRRLARLDKLRSESGYSRE